MRWKLRAEDGLKLASFDGECLVFNPVSWQTHLLNDSAARVLEALGAGPRSLEELMAAMAGGAASAESDPEVEAMVEALLSELETLGLALGLDPARRCE